MSRKITNIPGPLALPLLGTLHLYKLGVYKVEEYHKVLLKLHEKYGPIVRTQPGPTKSSTIVHLFDPDFVEVVHKNEGSMPYVTPLQVAIQQYRKVMNKSPGLGNINGEEWYRLRSAVRQIMLRPPEVQKYLPKINQITDELIARIQKTTENDNELKNIREVLSKWSREVAGWICFGRCLNSMDGSTGEAEADKIITANRKVFKLTAKLKFSLPIYQFISTPSWNEFVKAENVINESGENLLKEALSSLRNGKLDHCDLLKYLVAREDLHEQDIPIFIQSVFTDGLSTMVPILMNCLYCLATNPQVQEEAYAEIEALHDNGVFTAAALDKMPYIKALVKEVFRMYPNSYETDRILQSDHEIGGYFLPANTKVTMNQAVHFRSEKYFDDPNKFIPSRWLRESNSRNKTIHKFLLLPFGYGSRSCIGRRLAEQDLYVSISKILLNFQLSAPYQKPLEIIYETLLFPKEPLKIQFRKRG